MTTTSIPAPAPLPSVDTSGLPWVRWGFRGSQFKLLHADPANERFTILMKIEPGVTAPRHRHLGTVEAYVLEGSFYYLEQPDQVFTPGCYLVEQDGSVHQPTSLDGVVMLATFYGSVQAIDANGQTTGGIDCRWHIEAWKPGSEAAPG